MYSVRKRRQNKPGNTLLYVLLFMAIAVSLILYIINKQYSTEPTNNIAEHTISNNDTETESETLYDTPNLQPTINDWLSKQAASYSIEIYDLQSNSVIAKNRPDEEIFAASLYKIYIAYLSLIDFQEGKQNPNEALIGGKTKKECVVAMIRSSDSPCGEAMMSDIGQTVLNDRVKQLGAKNTYFNGIRTSAEDSIEILKLISNKVNLTKDNYDLLLDAMLNQDSKFKRGLASGSPEARWYTKVGWNENVNYHDIGILELSDGRRFAVAVLGQGSGSPQPIADLSSIIFSELLNSAI